MLLLLRDRLRFRCSTFRHSGQRYLGCLPVNGRCQLRLPRRSACAHLAQSTTHCRRDSLSLETRDRGPAKVDRDKTAHPHDKLRRVRLIARSQAYQAWIQTALPHAILELTKAHPRASQHKAVEHRDSSPACLSAFLPSGLSYPSRCELEVGEGAAVVRASLRYHLSRSVPVFGCSGRPGAKRQAVEHVCSAAPARNA